MAINETLRVNIKGRMFSIKVVEDSFGILRLVIPDSKPNKFEVFDSECSLDSWVGDNDVVPFTPSLSEEKLSSSDRRVTATYLGKDLVQKEALVVFSNNLAALGGMSLVGKHNK